MSKDLDNMFKPFSFPVTDAVKLGSYKVVEREKLSTIVTVSPEDEDPLLDGIILRGYETKFNGKPNENYEVYEKTCLDAFLEKYYTKNRLNMPLTIQHKSDLLSLAGRVLVCEVNSVGFYFVCYIPKTYKYYTEVLALLKEGILQGLSKEGWCTKGHWVYKKDGDWDYYVIEEMELTAMSLVTTPANGVRLEKLQEITNALKVIKPEPEASPETRDTDELFT